VRWKPWNRVFTRKTDTREPIEPPDCAAIGDDELFEYPSRLTFAGPRLPSSGVSRRELVKLRILVVDDNEDAADTLAAMVRLWGHDACCAYDGSSALGLAPDYGPEVVLLDVGLPGIDGYELARRLRAVRAVRVSRIIAVTGYAPDRAREYDATVDGHMIKPIDPMTLELVLASITPYRFGAGAP